MPDAPIELLFLGTGTSAGVPMIGCRCEVCRSADPRDKRTRPSVVISRGATRVLVDTTPELRLQCVANGVNRSTRWSSLTPTPTTSWASTTSAASTRQGGPLDVWADDADVRHALDLLRLRLPGARPQAKLFRPHLVRRPIELGRTFEAGGMEWTPVPLLHGDLPVLGFRVGRLAYCTDVSEIPESSFPLLARAGRAGP